LLEIASNAKIVLLTVSWSFLTLIMASQEVPGELIG